MKYCKAWPDACKQLSVGSSSKVEPESVHVPTPDAIVYPKQLIEATVEESVDSILRSKFPMKDLVVPEEPKIVVPEIQEEAVVVRKPISGRSIEVQETFPRRQKATNDLMPVWITLGIMGFLMLVLVWGLMQRVQSLESWLHGRLMSRP
jgi:hypothetical protein